MLKTKYIFEISIYRLDENLYYNNLKTHMQDVNSKMQAPMDENYLRKKYGGDWQYNEVIGYLRFYQYGGNQIRCEYWETDTVRKVKTRKKQFIQISDSYCNQPYSKNSTNRVLAKTMRSAVEHCEKRLKKSRYLHRVIFDNTVEHINWSSLLA